MSSSHRRKRNPVNDIRMRSEAWLRRFDAPSETSSVNAWRSSPKRSHDRITEEPTARGQPMIASEFCRGPFDREAIRVAAPYELLGYLLSAYCSGWLYDS